MDLRPYQLDAVEGCRTLIRERKKRILLIAPTGAGKTVMFSHIVSRAVERGSRALILAHRRELVKQASDKLLANGVHHGIIQAGFRPAPQRPVQVASVQTLARRPEACTQVDLVVVDECHHVTTENTYAKLLSWYPQAIILGVTATPWRLDGQGLADVFEGHVLTCTPRDLRDEGFLVPVGGWEYEGIDTSHARVRNGDYVAQDMHAAATSRKVVGDIVTEWLKFAAGKRTVLFAVTVEHSQQMVEAFRKEGVPAEHLDGNTPTAERDAVLERLRSGQTLVVCNCNVLTEGFDCPELEVCVLARPTLSTSLYLQMVGRALRPVCFDCRGPVSWGDERCGCGSSNIKRLARIHDHAGCLAAHGHPYAERDYSPTLTARVSRGDAEDPRGRSRVRRCKECKAVLAGLQCDACGWKPTQLELVQEELAARRAIGADGSAPKSERAKETDDERARRWKVRFAGDELWKRDFFERMVAKHGIDKGARVYWWFSGKLERPPTQWLVEARARHQEGSAA